MTDQTCIPGTTDARIPICELKSGQAVEGPYCCSDKIAATDRNGKAYLRLKLRDASGEVAAIHFDPSDDALGITVGDVVIVGGTFSVHPQYGAQVQVRRLRAADPDEYAACDLVPVSPIGPAELAERLARARRLRRGASCARPSRARAGRHAGARRDLRGGAGGRAQPSRVPARPARALAHRGRGGGRRGVAASPPSTTTSSSPAASCTTSARPWPTPATAWRRR